MALVIPLNVAFHKKDIFLIEWNTQKPLIIGRDTVPILESKIEISRRHLLLTFKKNEIHIEDLKSKNGTFINGVRIFEGRLFLNDKITLWGTEIMIDEKKCTEDLKSLLVYSGDDVKRKRGEVTMHLDKK
jgi:pSer/pThr/pTyr-binding forkhead associated (FHA) protein